MRKIVFCYFAPWYAYYTPLDIGYILAQIRQKNLKFDLQAIRLDYFDKDYAKKIPKADVVFFFLDSVIWSGVFAFKAAYLTAKKLKEQQPGIFVGMHSHKILSTMYNKAFEAVDCLVLNDPEQSFLELDKILKKEKVSGVMRNAKETQIVSDTSNLKKLSSPYLNGIFDNHIKTKTKFPEYCAYVQTCRGCLYGCYYCFRSVKFDKVRYFPVKRVYDEIEYLMERGVIKVLFIDDCFLTTKERLLEFRDEFNARKIKNPALNNLKLSIMCRPDELTQEIIKMFSELNIIRIQIGLQTVNPKLQKFMKRDMDLNNFPKIAKWLRKYQIETQIDVIWGLPGDTIENYKKSVQAALSLKPSAIQTKQLYLNPGTIFEQNQAKYKIKTTKPSHLGVPYVKSAIGIDENYQKQAYDYTMEIKKRYPQIYWKWSAVSSSWHEEANAQRYNTGNQ